MNRQMSIRAAEAAQPRASLASAHPLLDEVAALIPVLLRTRGALALYPLGGDDRLLVSRGITVSSSFAELLVSSVVSTGWAASSDTDLSPTETAEICAGSGVRSFIACGSTAGLVAAVDETPRAWSAEDHQRMRAICALGGSLVRGGTILASDSSPPSRAVGALQEEALWQSEVRTRLIIEMAHDAFIAVDPAGAIIDWNAQAERTFGWTRDEVIGRSVVETLVPERFRGRYREELERFERQRTSEMMNRRIDLSALNRQGHEIAVEVTISPISTGDSYLLSAFLHDITQRRRREEELRLSEERYRLVSRATNDVIRDWNLVNGETEWNEAAHRVFRYPVAELGKGVDWWYDRVHPEERERVLGGLQAVVEGIGESWSGEYRFRRGDGSYAVMLDRAYVVRNEQGEPSRIVSSMLDVTERTRAEETHRFLAQASTLLDSSLDYEAILLSLARLAVPQLADYCLIDLLDGDGTSLRRVAAIHRDPAKQHLLRTSESIGLDDDPALHPSLAAFLSAEAVLVPDCDAAAIERISHDPEHLDALRHVGLRSFIIAPMVSRERTLGTITLAFSDSDRRHSAVDLVVAEDLARRAALAVDNALLLRRSREAVKARDDILAVVSHDLRNPVNTIRISADLVLDRMPTAAQHRRPVEIIRRCSVEMEDLIQDLLDVTQLDAGRIVLGLSDCSLETIVDEVSEAFDPIANREGIVLTRSFASSLPLCRADPVRIRQMLSNLVANALKFTPRGGRVDVVVGLAGAKARIEVRDTGVGIPADLCPRIFDRFWQADGAGRRGAGLGLAIAKGIAEAHGGSIEVESVVGEGSVFRLYLPVIAPDAT